MRKIIFTIALLIMGFTNIIAQNPSKSPYNVLIPAFPDVEVIKKFDEIQIVYSSLFKEIPNIGSSIDNPLENIPGANAINMIAINNDLNQPNDLSDSGHSLLNTHSLVVPEGWSGLSSYLTPDNTNIENLFLPYQNQLIILYNHQGVYYPAQQLNTLVNWDAQSGYIAKFNQETSIEFSGQPVQSKVLSLTSGWYLIPVLSECPADVATLFGNSDVVVVKEVAGWKLYWPEMGINTIDELLPGNAYYVLMNSPAEITFPNCGTPPWQCGDSFIDTRDDKTYGTVQIGTQCWMSQNLNVGALIDGYTYQSDNGLIEKYCYNNDETNCDIYGGLYQWNEIMQYTTVPGSLGICPSGWHVPNNTEWSNLSDFLGSDAGGQLKEAGISHWNSPNSGATNSSGFTALPAGSSYWGDFYDIGNYEFFGVSTFYQDYTDLYILWGLSYNDAGLWSNINGDYDGISVRCIKGETAAAELKVSPIQSWAPPESGTTTINIYSNVSWTIEETSSWFTVAPISGNNNGTIIISYDENTSFDDREGQINITANGGTLMANATLLQSGISELSVTPEWQTVPADAGTTILEVSSNDSWTVQVYDSWLSALPTSGILNGTITLEYEANPSFESRYGNIYVSTIHGYSSVIYIEQQGLSFTVTPLEQYVTAASGTTTFDVASFTSWTVEESVDWLSVSPMNGSDNGTLTVTYDENTSIDPRVGQITITADGGTPVFNVTLLQSGVNGSCGQIFDSRDGQTYPTIQIGSQCWMAKNLNIGASVDGTTDQTDNGLIEKHCNENNETNCVDYGGLYQWNEMMQYSISQGIQGICPIGWHVPTDAEWCTLTTFLDVFVDCGTIGSSGFDVGGKLKESGTTHWISPNYGATNSSGFTALPGGNRIAIDGSFANLFGEALFWTSTEGNDLTAYRRTMANYNQDIYRDNDGKFNGFSVRCLKDETTTSQLDVYPLTNDVTSTAGITTFDVQSNLSWTVTESVEWLSVSPMNGSDNGTLTVTYDENTSFDPRVGQITITSDGVTLVVNVTLNQAGFVPTLTVIPANQNVLAEAGTTTFEVTSNISWAVEENVDWLSVSPMYGSDNGTLTLTYDENTSFEPRVGQITITGDSGTLVVNITLNQAGVVPILMVNPTNQNVTIEAGTTTFNVSSNLSWTVVESISWLSVFPASGSNNGTITVNYEASNVNENRMGQITIIAASGTPIVNVTVSQGICGQPITDTRDGKTYNTVQIGTQCWMAQNLNIGIRITSTYEQTNNGSIEKYCYENLETNCDVYGGLYQWHEMMQFTLAQSNKGICPIGWHLPTDDEWCILEQEVDCTITCGSTGWYGVDGGGKLKETGTNHWISPNTVNTNSSGFNCLPGGNSYWEDGSFYELGHRAYLWSSTVNPSNNWNWNRMLQNDHMDVFRTANFQGLGCSVRCLKD